MLEHLTQYESDNSTPVYFQTVREHEMVFRGVLKHIRQSIPHYMPDRLDIHGPLDELLQGVNPRVNRGGFNVYEFLVGEREGSPLLELTDGITESQVLVAFGDRKTHGSAYINRYDVGADADSISFSETVWEIGH